ncbi:MAG TPA: winged helix-turn-helix transcriptional regulator [Candidatus Thermoplasmatota archaeon]|nr:winged helix-turn-helix transcriptional regulator [Candidatus Thermoplasmatota archaeon]
MRSGTLVAALLLLAVPMAAAGGVTFQVPSVHAFVEGHTVEPGGAEVADTPVRPEGGVTVHDVEVGVEGATCTVDYKRSVLESCQGGDVRSSQPTRLVSTDLSLVLAEEDAPASAEEDDADPAIASSAFLMQSPRAALLVAAATGASLAAVYAVWRLLKWTGLAAILPLYSHIRDDEILDDANRAAIYRLIQSEPGIATKDVAERLGLAWGTVTHHLAKLEKRRFVVSKKYGKYRRYFANGEGGTHEKDALAVLRVDRTGDVAALIRAQPGLTQKAVSEALGVSSSTILWHVKRLEDVQLVRKVRDGKLVRYYPAEAPAPLLAVPTAA